MTRDELKAFRVQMSYTQGSLAKLFGVHYRTIQNWEAGLQPIPIHIGLACRALWHRLPPWPHDLNLNIPASQIQDEASGT